MALAFVVLKQSFANDPVVNDPPEPSFQAYALFEPSSSTFTQSKGLFVDLTNSLLAGVILEANIV
jgi:hypothetical protein